MEAVDYGILCLIPPIVTVALALITKQTILSLLLGVWVGSTIINGWNPISGFVKIFPDFMIPSLGNEYNAGLVLLVTLAGGMIIMLRETGGAYAFAKLMSRKVDTPAKGQVLTSVSAVAFCYTEPCLILGTIMRPVTDAVRVSRAKLAYILDSLGCNLASFSPISSYGPFITGLIATELTAAGLSGVSEWGVWAGMLKYNMYSLFAILTVFIVAIGDINIGPMYKEEMRARREGKVLGDGVQPLTPEKKAEFPEGYEPTLISFVLPMAALFVSLFAVIFWTGDLAANGFAGCFRNANITVAIMVAFICTGITAGVVGVVKGLWKPFKSFNTFVNGMIELINVPFILVCAWSLGSVVSTMGTGEFLAGIVAEHLTPGLVPGLIFLFGALISFSTGSSWGTWSLLMPIAFPMAVRFGIPPAYIVGCVISSGLFGDQCSPISDTTVLSSTGGSCHHIVHVMTQIPYGVTVGVSALIGFLFGGLTGQFALSIAVTAVVLLIALFVLKTIARKTSKADTAAAA